MRITSVVSTGTVLLILSSCDLSAHQFAFTGRIDPPSIGKLPPEYERPLPQLVNLDCLSPTKAPCLT